MCIKKYIGIMLKKEYLLLKSLKLLFWVPIIALDIFLPLFSLYQYRSKNPSVEYNIASIILIIVPLFSAWWSIFILREFLESPGNEVLFSGKKVLLFEISLPFIIYVIDTVAVLCGISNWFPKTIEMIKPLLIVIFFMFALSYFMSFVSKSITISLLINVVYVLANQVIYTKKPLPFLYISAMQFDFKKSYTSFVTMLIVSAFLIIAGLILNKEFKHYKT